MGYLFVSSNAGITGAFLCSVQGILWWSTQKLNHYIPRDNDCLEAQFLF